MSAAWKRIPWAPLVLGAALLAAGLFGAFRELPEWRAVPPRPGQALRDVARQLASVGGKLTQARLVLVSRSEESDSVSDAFKQLGRRATAYLASTGGAVAWAVTGSLQVPKIGIGPVVVRLAPDGSIRSFAWLPGGTLVQFTPQSEQEKSVHAAFLESCKPLVTGSRKRLGEIATYTRGIQSVTVERLAPGDGPPEETLVSLTPLPIRASRGLAPDPDSMRSFGGRVDRIVLRRVPTFLLILGTVILFFVLLMRRRLSFRVALVLGGLSAAAMLPGLGGSERLLGTTMEVATAAYEIACAIFLVALWAVAESLLRDTVPGFTTSLDTFAAGRLGPRGARAILAGLGFGAAGAGTWLLFFAFAARHAGPILHPADSSCPVSLISGTPKPFIAGTFRTALLILLVATLRFRVRRPLSDYFAAGLFGLYLSLYLPLEPWGFSLVLALALAGILFAAFHRYGFATLLVAAVSMGLLRDGLAAMRFLDGNLLAAVVASGSLGAFLLLGLVGTARPEREDEGRVEAPDYVKRIDSERRVKYEMDLLSRMQIAMLPDHPPAVRGLDISVRTILATEAGGDLYEFIEEPDGLLWIAAGDVSGHGYSCGIQGAMVKAALLSLAKDGRCPGEVLCEIDRVLRAAKAGRLFTSLALMTLDPKTGKGLLANAGHPFPLLAFEGKCAEVAGSGLPLGQGPPRTYADLPVEIPEGGSLVFASDGLFEGPDRFDDPYGYERPRAVLESVGLWRRPAEAIVEALFADWRDHVGEGAPADDTTILVVKRPALAW